MPQENTPDRSQGQSYIAKPYNSIFESRHKAVKFSPREAFLYLNREHKMTMAPTDLARNAMLRAGNLQPSPVGPTPNADATYSPESLDSFADHYYRVRREIDPR